MLSSAQGSLRVITLADGGPRPLTRADLLYVRSEPFPLFVQFLQAFFTFLPWLHQALSCGVLLLMKRLYLFVLRLFVTCEDYRLRSAPDIIFNALSEFTAESWQALFAFVYVASAAGGQGGPAAGGEGFRGGGKLHDFR